MGTGLDRVKQTEQEENDRRFPTISKSVPKCPDSTTRGLPPTPTTQCHLPTRSYVNRKVPNSEIKLACAVFLGHLKVVFFATSSLAARIIRPTISVSSVSVPTKGKCAF